MRTWDPWKQIHRPVAKPHFGRTGSAGPIGPSFGENNLQSKYIIVKFSLVSDTALPLHAAAITAGPDGLAEFALPMPWTHVYRTGKSLRRVLRR